MGRIDRYTVGRKAKRLCDHADRLLLDGKITQSDRNAMIRDINIWADEQYRVADAKVLRRAS